MLSPARSSLLIVCLLGLPAGAQDAARPDPQRIADPALRAEVAAIVADPSVETRVEKQVRCAGEIYRSLLADLPLAGKALRALDLGDYAIEAVEGGCTIDDKAGARARCVTAYDLPDRILVVARGTVAQGPLPEVHGTGVIHVTWVALADRPEVLQARCTVAFRLESRLLHLLTGPFRKLLAEVLGEKLTRLVGAAAPLAEAIQQDPLAVFAALEKKGEASPAELQRYRDRYLLR